MAYNVYVACDYCGDGFAWTNHTVSLSIAKKIARNEGWTIGKNGWICPECKEKLK